MGRFSYSNRYTTEELKSVSMSFLYRKHYLYFISVGHIQWTRGGEKIGSMDICVSTAHKKYARFRYTQTNQETGEKKDFNISINLLETKCNYGGVRYWFECPRCKRRVGVIYLSPFRDYSGWGCRKCFSLNYKSQRYGGIEKHIGVTRSDDELQNMYLSLRTKLYKGKPTKKYSRYLKHEKKATWMWDAYFDHLQKKQK